MPSLMNRLGKFSSAVKSKSAVVKEKMINYIKNEQQPTERLVKLSYSVLRPTRHIASHFRDESFQAIDWYLSLASTSSSACVN